MNKKYFLVFLASLIFLLGYSQETPILNAGNKPLGLSSLDIKVNVIGNIATTTYDMLFYNPTDEVLEGELVFPLGEGHHVSRFALEVNGKLREAVVVDKELGRIAFEEVVRRGVDPALLEKGTGNNYKARIYPIPSKGHKRVLLAYEQELVFNDGAHYYNLPLSFKNKLDKFLLEISIFDQKSKPIIEKGNISGLQFSNWKRNFKTKIFKQDYTPNQSLSIKIPLPLDTKKLMASNTYFYMYKVINSEKRLRESQSEISIYWDASLSMKNRDLKKELSFLDSYFAYVENIDVCFIAFSNSKLVDTTFKIKDCNWKNLRQEIEQIVYDGGTSYKMLPEGKSDTDAILFFSDGIANLSEADFKSGSPVFIINSMVTSNHFRLKSIAEKTNGAYINLKTKSINDAMGSIKYEPFKLLGYDSVSEDIEIYPNSPVSVSHDFSISGRGYTEGDVIGLNFGYGNEITQRTEIVIRENKELDINISRIWAQKKLEYLTEEAEKNKEQIVALGKEYSLVTDYTSLIVLENLSDYLKYEITPPKELLEDAIRTRVASEEIRRGESSMRARTALERPISENQETIIDDDVSLDELDVDIVQVSNEDIDESEDIDEGEYISFLHFSVLDITPVYPGCEEYLSKEERKTCFSEKVKQFIDKRFNSKLANDLNLLPGTKRINASFMVSSQGDIINIEVKAPHNILGEEAMRVLKLLPKMTPGKESDLPVDVLYELPIVINIKDTGKQVNLYAKEENVVLKANIVDVPTNQEYNNSLVSKTYSGDLKVKERCVMTDYIIALQETKNEEDAYELYVKQRENYLKVPAYFIDVSNHFQNVYKSSKYASRILSNIAEIDFDNYELLKVLGYQLQVNNKNDLALFVFKQILKLRPEDVQSYRDVAIAYQNAGKYQEALDFFNKIVSGEIYENSERRVFRGLKDIVINEIKWLVQHHRNDLDLRKTSKKMLKPKPFDIRITIDWNHNDTDIDMHIIDPNLEVCNYENRKTEIGGRLSKDMIEGFGPEEFTLEKAIKGDYYIKINYYGDRYQKVENPTFMKVTIFKENGLENSSKETKLIRLTKIDEQEIIAKITI